MSSDANLGWRTMSPRTSRACGQCSSSTLAVKAVISFEVKASRLPPKPSMAYAISRAEYRSVPLNTMCSTKCVMPLSASVSWRDPFLSQMPIATERTDGMHSLRTVRPFGKTVLRTLSGKGVSFIVPHNQERRLDRPA